MFLNFIKEFSLKKIIKKTLSNYQAGISNGKIATVGIVLDEPYIKDKETLINTFTALGIQRNNIEILCYVDKVKKGEKPGFNYCTPAEITGLGEFSNKEAAAFINKPFDLLVSYYDTEKPTLVLATLKSKAAFKAGFAAIDNRLNGLLIAAEAAAYKVYTEELIKYLKLLNKL